MKKRKISIVTPCFNEKHNIKKLVSAVKRIILKLKSYDYEHIIIDNCSTDGTVSILENLARLDKKVHVIFNERNFGFSRSLFYGLTQASGDCAILLFSDFQDPPDLIPKMIDEWSNDAAIVVCIKESSDENLIKYSLRTLYYKIMKFLTNGAHLEHFTGFGLYDKKFINFIKKINDPNPYLRGLVADFGFRIKKISYKQKARKYGNSNFSISDSFDYAMHGLIANSFAPMRILVVTGFITSLISFLIGVFYLTYKILNWDHFNDGYAGLAVAIFFIGSIQLLFLGLLGEYVCANLLQSRSRPLVIEKKRLNF